jgi:protein-tyrosine-phosphatase
MNSVRSVMAEAIMKHLFGHTVYIDSVGMRTGDVNTFAVVVMDEIGIDITRHRSKSFEDLDDDSFDLIISLSPESQHGAVEMTRNMACEVEFWNTFDPTYVEGSREVCLAAFREVRDSLMARIKDRFGRRPPPVV